MNLNLSPKETTLVCEILKSRLGTLRQEVYHAETPGFKDELKEKEKTLEALIQKVEKEGLEKSYSQAS